MRLSDAAKGIYRIVTITSVDKSTLSELNNLGFTAGAFIRVCNNQKPGVTVYTRSGRFLVEHFLSLYIIIQ